jgi:MFS family permease
VGRSSKGRFIVPRIRQVALFLAIAIDAVGTGAFVPVSLLYFTRVAGLSLPLVGVLTTVATVVSLPVPILAGHLADRFRPRPVVIAGQLLQAVGFGGFLLARRPGEVLVVTAAIAVGQRLFWSSLFTLVAATSDPDGDGRTNGPQTNDRRFAVTGMVQAAGTAAGMLAAGAVLTGQSEAAYRLLAAVNAVSFLVSVLLIGLVPAGRAVPLRRPGEPGGYRMLVRDRPFLLLTAVNSVFCLCSVLLGIGLPVYLTDGLHAAGWVAGPVLAANIALLATGQLFAVRAVRRLTRVRALAVAGVLWTAWGVLTAAATAVPGRLLVVYLVAVTALYAAAELVHAPVSNALAAEAAPQQAHGSYLAVFQYGFTIATLVAPAGFTLLFAVDPRLPWLAIAVLAGLATIALPRLARTLPARAVHGELSRSPSA